MWKIYLVPDPMFQLTGCLSMFENLSWPEKSNLKFISVRQSASNDRRGTNIPLGTSFLNSFIDESRQARCTAATVIKTGRLDWE
jgi:hypothetical protein